MINLTFSHDNCRYIDTLPHAVRGHRSWNILRISYNNGTVRLKNANNFLNNNIYSYLETSGGESSNLYLNVVHVFNTSVN